MRSAPCLLSQGQETAILPAALGSFTAYAVAALFSYTGHKYFTFVSGGEHLFEAPRFLVLTSLGLGFSWLLPVVLVDWFNIRPLVPILVTCIAVPMVNYLVLNRWVFATAIAAGDRNAAQ